MNELLQLKDLPKGVLPAGMKPKPAFIVGAKVDNQALQNIALADYIQHLLNNNLTLINYISDKAIKNSYFIYIILPKDKNGVDWKETMHLNSHRKTLHIDIVFPDYEGFCRASRTEALQIMAQQTLRGVQKFLPSIKDFDYPKFYNDLYQVFQKNGLVV